MRKEAKGPTTEEQSSGKSKTLIRIPGAPEKPCLCGRAKPTDGGSRTIEKVCLIWYLCVKSLAFKWFLRNEFFGKFGKIIKVAVGAAPAINSSQPAVHTAYITYTRSEDALKAIQAVNNMVVEGRFLKASLGTTKYCSNFLKGLTCHKPVTFIWFYYKYFACNSYVLIDIIFHFSC